MVDDGFEFCSLVVKSGNFTCGMPLSRTDMQMMSRLFDNLVLLSSVLMTELVNARFKFFLLISLNFTFELTGNCGRAVESAEDDGAT
jgi:hypothetical protein